MIEPANAPAVVIHKPNLPFDIEKLHKAMNQSEAFTKGYDPDHLLDALIEAMQLTNDRALARRLNVAEAVVRNIRRRKLPVTGSMLMWMHEATGISIAELRRLMGDRRTKFRLSSLRSSVHS